MALRKPDWAIEGADWPNRAASRFVAAGGLDWHVQVMGQGPVVLLLHGAGGASHSFADLAPALADQFTVVIPDLPGHGFTHTPAPEGLALPGMAQGVGALLATLGRTPALVVGHSAGAAIALHMSLAGRLEAAPIIALNGARKPFPGPAATLLPTLTRLVFLNEAVIGATTRRAARPGRVERLIAGTGSVIPPRSLAAYAALFQTPGHVAGAFGMMARWDLRPLEAALPRLAARLLLVTGSADRAVSPEVSAHVARRVAGAEHLRLPGFGHLIHEEAPELIANHILRFARQEGVLPGSG